MIFFKVHSWPFPSHLRWQLLSSRSFKFESNLNGSHKAGVLEPINILVGRILNKSIFVSIVESHFFPLEDLFYLKKPVFAKERKNRKYFSPIFLFSLFFNLRRKKPNWTIVQRKLCFQDIGKKYISQTFELPSLSICRQLSILRLFFACKVWNWRHWFFVKPFVSSEDGSQMTLSILFLFKYDFINYSSTL